MPPFVRIAEFIIRINGGISREVVCFTAGDAEEEGGNLKHSECDWHWAIASKSPDKRNDSS
jgi:hypothetical protein